MSSAGEGPLVAEAPQAPREPSTTRPPHRLGARRWREWLAVAVALSLAAFTTWRATRPVALQEAIAAERKGDNALALRRALDHLDRAPQSARAALIAARSLTGLHFPDQAEPYYEAARRGGYLTLTDLHRRALGLAEANRLDQAVSLYEQILHDHPDDAQALQRLAAIRYAQSRWKEALELARTLGRLPGHAVAAWGLIGSIEHEQKHPDQAAAAYQRVLALDPDLRSLLLPRSLFWTNLARDLIDSGHPAKAREYLERALAEHAEPVQMDLLGLAYQCEGNLDQAEPWFRRAIQADPKLFPAWLHLGRLLLQPQRNRLPEAIEVLQQAAALAPASFEPRYSLSLAYRRLGRDAEADRFQKQAEALRKPSQAAPPVAGGSAP